MKIMVGYDQFNAFKEAVKYVILKANCPVVAVK